MRRRSFGQDLLCAPFAEIPCALDAGAGFTTGGMFSTFFPRPSWQTDPVHAYLDANKDLPTTLFNASGRACALACCPCAGRSCSLSYPITAPASRHADNDVGAFGNNIMVVTNGKIGLSGGTSASGPIFAGESAGDEAEHSLPAGRPPLRLLTPTLAWITACSRYRRGWAAEWTAAQGREAAVGLLQPAAVSQRRRHVARRVQSRLSTP